MPIEAVLLVPPNCWLPPLAVVEEEVPLRCCSLVLLVGPQAAAQEAHLAPALEAAQVSHLAAHLVVVLVAHLAVLLVEHLEAHLEVARVSHLAAAQVVAQVAPGRKLELLAQRVDQLEQPSVEQMGHTLPAFQVPNP